MEVSKSAADTPDLKRPSQTRRATSPSRAAGAPRMSLVGGAGRFGREPTRGRCFVRFGRGRAELGTRAPGGRREVDLVSDHRLIAGYDWDASSVVPSMRNGIPSKVRMDRLAEAAESRIRHGEASAGKPLLNPKAS